MAKVKETVKEAKDAVGTVKEGADWLGAGSQTMGVLNAVASPLAVVSGGITAKDMWDDFKSPYYNEDKGALKGGMAGYATGAGTAGLAAMAGYAGLGLLGPLGLAAGLLYGKYGQQMRTGKGKDQLERDIVRKGLEKKGFLADKGRYVLSDGSTFEMGKDGGFKYDDGLAAYEVDHKDPMQGVVFGHVLPLAELITGGDDELTAAFAGYFTRAAISNSNGDLNKALDNAKDMAGKLGIDQKKGKELLNGFTQQGKIDNNNLGAYNASIDNIFAHDRNLNFSALFSSPEGDFSKSDKLNVAQKNLVDSKPRYQEQVQKAVNVVSPTVQSQIKDFFPNYQIKKPERAEQVDSWFNSANNAIESNPATGIDSVFGGGSANNAM